MTPFPSDQTFDRGAPRASSTVPTAAAGAPVETLCEACAIGICCGGVNAECSCPCRNETDEEFVAHENDETLRALADEGATDILRAVQDEVWGSPLDGRLEQVRRPW